jgi:uncharacterized protein (DUF58 family)
MPTPSSSRVWVVPNGRTIGLFAVLVAMCYAGASQGNGAAYLLCFLLTSLTVVSFVHAWANLQGLEVSIESIAPVFVGEEVIVRAIVKNREGRARFGLRVFAVRGERPLEPCTVKAGATARLDFRFIAKKRGHYQRVEMEITSDYPLGFLTARQFVTLRHEYDIYPAPRGALPWPRSYAPTRQPRDGVLHEGDDFGGTRLWRHGESQRHIDWKAAARTPILLTKQWTGEVDDILRFEWDSLPGAETEARLGQIAKWIVSAEHSYESYALRLPAQNLGPARGESHYHQCLRALATFQRAEMKGDA